MAYRAPLHDTMVGLPGAVAAGVGRGVVDHKVAPLAAGDRIDKRYWLVDGATVGVGLLGLLAGLLMKDDTFSEATEGLTFTGFGYGAEDVTRLLSRPKASESPTGYVDEGNSSYSVPTGYAGGVSGYSSDLAESLSTSL